MPAPRRRPGEPSKVYAGRLIAFYTREGYPHEQAIAIGLRVAGVPKKSRGRPNKRTRRGRADR